MQREQLKGHLDLLLLAVLDGSPRHGYAVISLLRERSGGAFDLPEGTIYPALHRLEKAGYVRSRWSEVDGRRRRVYSLAAAGATALGQRRRQWAAFSGGVEAVLSA